MASKKPAAAGEQIVCVNRQARHNYFIDETYEAGMMLVGSEVKLLREGKANLVDSYARINKGEAFLVNAHISAYSGANQFNHEPTRTRKLLLHGREIERLTGKAKERGLTLIPLKIYFKKRAGEGRNRPCPRQKAVRQTRNPAPQSRPARSGALDQVAALIKLGLD